MELSNGLVVGAFDGDADSSAGVGDKVGALDGIAIGDLVGGADGSVVGASDGAFEGPAVGCTDGAFEGPTVGCFVGTLVGGLSTVTKTLDTGPKYPLASIA